MKNYRKGQAAMEYLMTYGWALLAIVIVIAALIYLNPFSAPELCLFQQQGFSCSEPNPQIYSDGGDVSMNVRIWNKLGKTVEIKGIVCTNAQATEVELTSEFELDQTIPTGSSDDFFNIDCIDSDGDQIQMQPNVEFRGKLIVWYNYEDDLSENIKHEAQANVISVVVEGEDTI
ncbi:hypothetical protein GF412_04515 [Candidatus Micrarchaeota archaeon]|nr:hypothetical protein [Candidatus Micrarchaeota archaeon]MBD3418215.1 hypothetical protein [Candidatus Micrarchaeota archaeon]